MNEQLFETSSSLTDAEQKLQLQESEWKQQEEQLKKDLAKTKDSLTSALHEKKTVEQKYDSHISKFNAEKEEESEQKSQRIQELEAYLKQIEDENESLKNKYDKDQAISQQKIEFM